MKFLIIFSAALEKNHGLFFIAGRIVDIGEGMVSSDVLSNNSSQAYRCYIRLEKFLFQRPNDFNIIKEIYEEETSSRTLGISHLDD